MGWDVSMKSPPQASGDSVEKTVRASGNREHKETKPSEHSTSNTHELLETVAACTGLHKSAQV